MPKNVYLFYGDDKALISLKMSEVTNKLVTQGVTVISNHLVIGNDKEHLFPLHNSMALSLPDTKYLTTVQIPSESLNLLNDSLLEFVQYLKNFQENNIIFLLIDSDKLDKNKINQLQRSKLFLSLKEFVNIESCIKLKPWEINEIKSFVLKTAQANNLTFVGDALSIFCGLFDDKTDQIPSELYKLHVYLFPDSKITKDVLNSLYSNDVNLDSLVACFLKSQYEGLFGYMNRLKQLLPPLYIISVMQAKIRQYFRIKTLLSYGFNQNTISSTIGMHPFRLKIEIEFLTDISLIQIKKLLNHISLIEYKLKTGLIKDSNVLDMLIVA